MRGIGNALRVADRIEGESAGAYILRAFTQRQMATENVTMVPAIITLPLVVTTDLKWKYEWSEVRFTEATTSVATKTNGLSKANAGFAYNWNELKNTISMWAPLGSPVNVPAGFKLQPIAVDTPVLLFPIRDTTGKVWWIFDKVNAIDGECP